MPRLLAARSGIGWIKMLDRIRGEKRKNSREGKAGRVKVHDRGRRVLGPGSLGLV